MTDLHPTDSAISQQPAEQNTDSSPVDLDYAESHGPGDLDSLPQSDFVSFATDDVEEREETE